MDAATVRDAYHAADSSEVAVEAFQDASFAYATTHPEASSVAAAMYVSQGERRARDLPIGDRAYVTELFAMSLRQPRETRVARGVAMAVSMCAIPVAELGRATVEERYLTLHMAAMVAQQDIGALAADLVRTFRRPVADAKNWTLKLGASAIGLFVLIVVISNQSR